MNKKYHCLLIILIGAKLLAQNTKHAPKTSFFVAPEILMGKTMEANTGFPETSPQKALFFSIGRYNDTNEKEWALRLNQPKTGISFAVIDFGNTEKLGKAYTVMPFMEFGLFAKKSQRWNLQVGFGASYADTQYDIDINPFNRAITTKVNWSFRSFVYYDFLQLGTMDWRFGLGYVHHSNGHTQLPNQGLNSLLVGISSNIGLKNNSGSIHRTLQDPEKTKTSQTFFSARSGVGQNVLSEVFNTKKDVYSFALSAGKIINKTFKFGGGFYYRFYEHYYNYINNGGALIEEQGQTFKENPYGYATNFGVSASAELLMSHIGIEIEIGMNIYKPFYSIDWQLSQGFSSNGVTYPAELDWYYEIKRTIASRLGLKYYLFTTDKAPRYNLFLSAHINANLGQADFSELSFGYVYRFKSRT